MHLSEPMVRRPAGAQRLILFLGFGSLLLLMGVVAYRANRTLVQIQTTNAKIRKEMVRRDELLDRVRSDVFRSGIEIRDYLLDLDPAREQSQRAELQSGRDQITATIRQYVMDLEPAESSSAQQLSQGLAEYWKALEPVFLWSTDYRRLHSEAFLRQEMIPRRQSLLQLVDRIAAIDEKQMQAGEDSMVAVQQQLREELTESSLVLLGIGLLVGIFSIGQITRLERISENQYDQVVHARGELRWLNARLVAAEEEERRKISRELHDQVGQHLSAVLIELGNVESELPRKEPELHRRISSARELTEASIAKVRDLALMLRPSMLDDLGLLAALRWHGREISRRTGVQVDVAADGVNDDIPNEYRTCIYRVVQEAMNNAVRHAKPAQIRVALRQRPEEIHVAIQDDGAGFDPRQDRGMGMLGMQERIQGLGGMLRIDSEPGSGTVVSVLLPLEQLASAGRNS